MKKILSSILTVCMVVTLFSAMTVMAYADEEPVYQDGFYTTTVNTEKESYGYQTDADGNITSYGFSYPKSNYDFPVTVQIKDGKIVEVAYTYPVLDVVANTSSDINYLMWAMDGHNVTDASYNYLAGEGNNYDKYHLDPKPPKNGTGMRDQIIEKQGTEGVDTVTAASITSRAIIRAVDQSLEKAKTGEKDDPEPELPQPDTTPAVIADNGIYMVGADEVPTVGASVSADTFVIQSREGVMTALQMGVEQRKSSYPHIYPGTEKEALAAGEAGWYYPVDYDYGYKYPGSIYRNVPIKSLDKPLNIVMFAKGSGNWFNRHITIESDKLVKIPYGDYEASEFSFEGGSGKVDITCEKVHFTREGVTADIKVTSSKYTKAVVDGVEYKPVVDSAAGTSTFTVPVILNGQTVFKGTTTAMGGTETEIEYTLTTKFDPTDLKPVAKVYQDGFYTTEVNTNKETYGYVTDDEGNITSYGFNYPKANYDFPVTVEIRDGKIVNVAYPKRVIDIVANTSSDINYLMWAMDGHNVTDASYNYLAGAGKNYDKYHVHPAKNGKGMSEQIIAANGTDGVDTVTSATITSRAIIDSVDKSLAKAEKGEKDDPDPEFPQPDTSEDIIPEDGTYTVKSTTVGFTMGNEEIVLIEVKDGVMTAKEMYIEQRQASYPYIYAGTEKEALAAGESAWLIPEDYDYGYKYPGSLYRDVPLKSLDKPLSFVMFAKGSGNWFNRIITLDSSTLTETEESKAAKKQAATEEASAAVNTAQTYVDGKDGYTAASYEAFEKALENLKAVLAKEDATTEELKAAKAAYDEAVAGLTGIKDQKLTVKAVNKTFKVKVLKKGKKVFKSVTVKGNQGKLSYAGKATGKSKKVLKFNKKNGKITVKKGAKKGKYVMTVTVKAAATAEYKAASKKVKVTVKVK